MKLFLLLLLLTACTTAPTDKLDLPKERWPMACPNEVAQLRYELARLRIEHELLLELGRNSSPPF